MRNQDGHDDVINAGWLIRAEFRVLQGCTGSTREVPLTHVVSLTNDLHIIVYLFQDS